MAAPRHTPQALYSQLEVVPSQPTPSNDTSYSRLIAVPAHESEKVFVAPAIIPVDGRTDDSQIYLAKTAASKRTRVNWIIWALIAVVVIIGAVLGGVLGTTLSKHHSTSSPPSNTSSGTSTTSTAAPTMSGTATILSSYSNPTAVSWGNPHLEVFALHSDNTYWKYRNMTTSWGPEPETFDNVGGVTPPFEQAIAAVARNDDNIDIFVTGTDFALYHKYHSTDLLWGPSETGWETRGGVLSTSPTVVSWASDRLDIFALGASPDYELFQMYYSSADGWSDWFGFPAGSWEVFAPTAVSWGVNRLDVFVVDIHTKNLFHTNWDGNSWQPNGSFNNLEGYCTSRPVALSRGSGLIDIFVRGGDAGLWQLSYSNGAWGTWTAVDAGTKVQGEPEAVSWGSDSIELFAWGAESSLLYKRLDMVDGVETWIPSAGFQTLGTGLTGPPKAVCDEEQSVHVFTYLQSGQLGHLAWDQSSAMWSPSTGFELLGTP